MGLISSYYIKNCIYCNSEQIKIIQLRNNKSGEKPIYKCDSCIRKFTPDNGYKKFRNPPIIIKTAINLIEQGLSLSQVTYYLDQTFMKKVTRKTILDWKRRFSKNAI